MSGDGPKLYDGVRESMEVLLPWMPRPAEHRTVEDLEASARGAGALSRDDRSADAPLAEGDRDARREQRSASHRLGVPKFEIGGYWYRRTGMTPRGYATEAVRSIATLAFDVLGAKRVDIRCDPLNRLGGRVAKLAGCRLEDELRNDAIGTDGTPVFSAIPGHTVTSREGWEHKCPPRARGL